MAIDLKALANGVKPVSVQSQVITAQVEPVAQQMVQVAAPANAENIDLTSINDNSDEIYQANFNNATGATQNIVLGGMFSLPGEYQYFGLTPSAVDFAVFTEQGATYASNGGTVRSLAKRFTMMNAIIHEIWLQSNVALQGTQNLTVGYITKSLNPKETTIYAPMCDACTNNNTTLFTKEFVGVYPVGKNNYIKIPIVAHADANKYTTVRLKWAAEGRVAALSQAQQF